MFSKSKKIDKNINDVDISIAVVGGGYTEYLQVMKGEVILGQKNIGDDKLELMWGNGVITSAFLLATHHETYPILSIGNDRAGYVIRNGLYDTASKALLPRRVLDFIRNDDFFAPNVETASAIIIADITKQIADKTVSSQVPNGNDEAFSNFLLRRLNDIEFINGNPPTAIQLCSFNEFRNAPSPLAFAEATKAIIEKYHQRSLLVFNLSGNQVELGVKYWEEVIQYVDVVQLNINNARKLLSKEYTNPSLNKIIDWFRRKGITVVITLSQFGAVGSFKNGREGITLAWPVEQQDEEYIEPTSFESIYSAAIVSTIGSIKNLSFSTFLQALDTGKFWSIYGSTFQSGVGNYPTLELLSKHREGVSRQLGYDEPTEVYRLEHAERNLKLIDKALKDNRLNEFFPQRLDMKIELKVFLCHSSNDKPRVRQIYDRLKLEKGIDPWLDVENLLPGEDWDLKIKLAVKTSHIVLVCLSKNSINKEGYIQKEIKQALDVADEKPDGTIFIIPLRLEDCEVPDRLKRWQWLNLFENDSYDKLLVSLRKRADDLAAKNIGAQ